MKQAKFVKELTGATTALGCRPKQTLWSLSEPHGKHDHVVVSSIPFAPDTGRSETLIFGATEYGGIVDFMDLDGSYRGGEDHEKALRGAGYDIAGGL